jgi:hypothetical protein
MTDAAQEPHPHLSAMANAFDAMKRTLVENDKLQAERDSFERQSTIAQSENEMLRKQVKSVKAERDHYMKAFTALSAQLRSLGDSFHNAVRMAEVHSYGDRSTAVAGRPIRSMGRTDSPPAPATFLERLRRDREQSGPVDITKLKEAISK